MCGSRYQGCKSTTHIVSAWADKNEMILGQIKVNEITTIPQSRISLNLLRKDNAKIGVKAKRKW